MFAIAMKTFLKSKTAHHNETDIYMFEDTACPGREIYQTNLQRN